MMKRLYRAPFTGAQLDACRDYWIKVGLSTDPINKPKVEQGLALAYAQANLKPPGKIIYCDSPHQGHRMARKLAIQGAVPVENKVWVHIKESVHEQVHELVSDDVWHQIWDYVWNSLWSQVWIQVGEKICASLGTTGSGYTYYAQHEADRLAQLMIFKDIPEVTHLTGLVQIAENSGWCFLFENLAIVTARPSKLLWRNNQCVHIEYPDGWAVSRLSPLEQLAVC